MKKYLLLTFTILFSLIIFSNAIVAISDTNQTEQDSAQNNTGVVTTSPFEPNLNPTSHERLLLFEGKNTVTTPVNFKSIYVKDLTKRYPEIEVISYIENNKSIGYINILNGIGKNFIVYPNRQYEITTKQNITLEI